MPSTALFRFRVVGPSGIMAGFGDTEDAFEYAEFKSKVDGSAITVTETVRGDGGKATLIRFYLRGELMEDYPDRLRD